MARRQPPDGGSPSFTALRSRGFHTPEGACSLFCMKKFLCGKIKILPHKNKKGLMKFMLEHWIWLSECKIGLHQKALLLRRYQDAETIYGLDESEYVVLGFNEKERTTLREKDLSAAQRILENCVNQGIRILTYQEARYPNRLRQLEQPPVLLYYKGQIPEFDTLPVIAAIGARKMSAHGYEMAKKLGYQMGRCGLTVISGIAAGIDAASDAERNVFEQLCLVPIQIDTLIEKTGLLAPQVLSALTMFEIQGLVKRLPGGQFRLNRECALLVEEDA